MSTLILWRILLDPVEYMENDKRNGTKKMKEKRCVTEGSLVRGVVGVDTEWY